MWIVTRESAFAIVLPSRHASMPPNNQAQRPAHAGKGVAPRTASIARPIRCGIWCGTDVITVE
jgi:hypothetical protein